MNNLMDLCKLCSIHLSYFTKSTFDLDNITLFSIKFQSTVFKISDGPRTLTGKIWVGPASFPSLRYMYINFGKIMLRSGMFHILFWRLITWINVGLPLMRFCGINLRSISQSVSKLQFYEISLKILLLKLCPHLPGASELSVKNHSHS